MTGMIKNTPGMINQCTGMINDNARMINETSTEHTENRRKRSKEMSKNSNLETFPLHTMNLPQFRNKYHEEFREYILKTKGVYIGSNFN